MAQKLRGVYGHIVDSFAWVGGATLLILLGNLTYLVWQVYNSFSVSS